MSVSHPSRTDYAGRFGVLPLAVVLLAAVVEVAASGSEAPRNVVGVPLALAGLLVVCWRSVFRLGPLFILAFTSSFVDYHMTLVARLSVGGVPLSVVDLALVATFLSLLVPYPVHRPTLPVAGMRRVLFATAILFGWFFPSFLVGLFVNQPYDVVRAFRPIVFIPIAFIAAVRKMGSWRNYNFLLQTVFLGGIYGMAVVMIARAKHMAQFRRFSEVRDFGYLNAGAEFAFVLAFVFVLCGERLYRSRLATWFVFAFVVVGAIFSLTLTLYAFVVLVPLLCLFVAPLPHGRRVLILSVVGGAAVLAVLLIPATQIGEAGGVSQLAAQVLAQWSDLRSSPHLLGRLLTWKGALDLVPGAKLLTGIGLGTRVWMYTQFGIFVAGEPTFASYLIDAGLIGIAALLWLMVSFVSLSYRRIRTSRYGFIVAVRSALTVYGVLTIVNGFLHNNFMTAQLSAMYAIVLAIAIRIDRSDVAAPVPQRLPMRHRQAVPLATAAR